MNFEIQLPDFTGPFDLLLFFIERDELDINDIPIAKITSDFLSYIEQLDRMNIEYASEFILVAASLMRIKAKLLLPRPELDDKGNEIDPREELVSRLLEYKKYKSIIAELAQLEQDRLSREQRGNVADEVKKLAEINNVESELQDTDLFKLLKVFQRVINRFETKQEKPRHTVVQYQYTIDQQKEYIKSVVIKGEKVSFLRIIEEYPEKIAIIFNFLAILELLQSKLVSIRIGEGYNNFWIEPYSEVTLIESNDLD